MVETEANQLKKIFKEVFPKMDTKYRLVKRGKINDQLIFEVRKIINQTTYINSHFIVIVEHINGEYKLRFDLVKYLNSLYEAETYIKLIKYQLEKNKLSKNKLNKEYIKKILLSNILKMKKW